MLRELQRSTGGKLEGCLTCTRAERGGKWMCRSSHKERCNAMAVLDLCCVLLRPGATAFLPWAELPPWPGVPAASPPLPYAHADSLHWREQPHTGTNAMLPCRYTPSHGSREHMGYRAEST